MYTTFEEASSALRLILSMRLSCVEGDHNDAIIAAAVAEVGSQSSDDVREQLVAAYVHTP